MLKRMENGWFVNVDPYQSVWCFFGTNGVADVYVVDTRNNYDVTRGCFNCFCKLQALVCLNFGNTKASWFIVNADASKLVVVVNCTVEDTANCEATKVV